MADQTEPQMTRDDANIHLGFTYLREDLQEVRQDIRELTRETNRRFDDVSRRFEEMSQRTDQRFDEMTQRLDQRFSRQTVMTTSTMIAMAAAIIAAVKL